MSIGEENESPLFSGKVYVIQIIYKDVNSIKSVSTIGEGLNSHFEDPYFDIQLRFNKYQILLMSEILQPRTSVLYIPIRIYLFL